MKWSQASSGAAGHHHCQAASTIISGVASMPEQDENENDACIAFLLSLNNANNASLGSSNECCFHAALLLLILQKSASSLAVWHALAAERAQQQAIQIACPAPHKPLPDDSASGTSSSSASLVSVLVICNRSSPGFWPAFCHTSLGTFVVPKTYHVCTMCLLCVYLVCIHMAWLRSM